MKTRGVRHTLDGSKIRVCRWDWTCVYRGSWSKEGGGMGERSGSHIPRFVLGREKCFFWVGCWLEESSQCWCFSISFADSFGDGQARDEMVAFVLLVLLQPSTSSDYVPLMTALSIPLPIITSSLAVSEELSDSESEASVVYRFRKSARGIDLGDGRLTQ